MTRARGLAAGLGALLALAGCQTWHDEADAKALATCAEIADPDARKTCQAEVMESAADAEARTLERQQELEKSQEERDRLRAVYSKPE